MKNYVILAVAILCTHLSFGQLNDTIVGLWQDADDPQRLIEFYTDDNDEIVGLGINKSTSKQTGKKIFEKLTYQGDSDTYTGIMTPPEKDISINATIYYVNENKIKIVGKKMLFKKTIILERVETDE